MKILLCILAIIIPYTFTSQGFDISYYHGNLTLDDFTCFNNGGFDLVILQAWTSQGPNKFFESNYLNALASPIPNIDIYAVICNQCPDNDPKKLCKDLYEFLPERNTFDGTLWLSVGPCDGCWSEDPDKNLDFIEKTNNKIRHH